MAQESALGFVAFQQFLLLGPICSKTQTRFYCGNFPDMHEAATTFESVVKTGSNVCLTLLGNSPLSKASWLKWVFLCLSESPNTYQLLFSLISCLSTAAFVYKISKGLAMAPWVKGEVSGGAAQPLLYTLWGQSSPEPESWLYTCTNQVRYFSNRENSKRERSK